MTDKCTSPEGHEWEPTYITFTRPTKPPAFARCTRCRTVLGKDKVVAMLNEHAALKRENERLKTYASTLLELALDDVELPLLTAEEQE